MKIVAAVILLSFASALTYAEGPKPCEVLKSEIAKKLEANGSRAYTLNIVQKDQAAEGKLVGSCEGGTKKIMYIKAPAPPKLPATPPKKP